MPEWLYLTIKILSGPIIGAVIGFFTNWLAVKMLFRPYKPKYIGKWRLPFTPGIIPKRKEALGRALGKAVSTQLITPTDIQKLFVTDEIKSKVGSSVATAIYSLDEDFTLRNLTDNACGEGSTDGITEKVSGIVTTKLLAAVQKLDLPDILSKYAGSALSEAGGLSGFLGMLGGNKILSKLAESVAYKLNDKIDSEGYDLAYPIVQREIASLFDNSVLDLVNKANLSEEKISTFVGDIYEKFVVEKIVSIVEGFDIAGTVAAKVNEMDMADLEKLFMSVMKKELGAIVNLGGLLGGLVGIINTLVMFFVL